MDDKKLFGPFNTWHSNSESYKHYDDIEGSYGNFTSNQPLKFTEFKGEIHGGMNNLKHFHFSFAQGGEWLNVHKR
jgi:hypothetical protein